jgi:hypothetical protein
MAVARVDVAPGIDDCDDGLARIIRLRAAHGSGTRTVAEGAQIVGAVPAVASQGLGGFSGHRIPSNNGGFRQTVVAESL